MNFKIIETSALLPDVLLYRDRDENGEEIVKIMAIGIIGGDSDMFAVETVVFDSKESASSYIKDFSSESAEKWCKMQEIQYE